MKLLSSYSTTFHLMANHTCEIEGALATGRSTAWPSPHRGAAGDNTLMVIRYRDRYARARRRLALRAARRHEAWTEHHAAGQRGSQSDGTRGRRRGRHRGGLGNGTRHGSAAAARGMRVLCLDVAGAETTAGRSPETAAGSCARG